MMSENRGLARSDTATSSTSGNSSTGTGKKAPKDGNVPRAAQQPLLLRPGVSPSRLTSEQKTTKAETSDNTFVVVTSGLGISEKRLTMGILQKLGGRVGQAVDSTCTHLVANEVGSAKYLQAVERSIPIVTFDFIKGCIAENKIVDFREYQCGAFRGCTICPSGFSEATKKEIKEIVERNGGAYDGTMTLGVTTHLVVGDDGFGQAKHKNATEWKIKAVSIDWIRHCDEQGAWAPEAEFAPKEPSNSAAKRSISPLTDPPKRSRSIDDLQPREASPPPLDPDFEQEKRFWNDLEKEPTALKCLRRCFILIDCKHHERWKVLRNIARFCGATILWEYSPIVTHVVVARSSPPAQSNENARGLPSPPDPYAAVLRSYFQKNPMIHCVQPKFLLTCATEMEWVEEKLFECRSTVLHPLRSKRVCVSNYQREERREVERLCTELGGEYSERFDLSCTHMLICKGETGDKYRAAKLHGIPVYDLEWLRRQRSGEFEI